jgi:hypothetical protein
MSVTKTLIQRQGDVTMKRLKALLTIMMVFGFIMILSGAAKSDMDISEVSDSICDVFCGLICLISGFIMRLYLDAYILKKRRSAVRKVKNIRISSSALHSSQKGIRQARKPFVIPEIV